METPKKIVLLIDGIIGILILAGLLFGDWEYMLSDEGSSILVLVLGIIFLLILIILGATFWAFKVYKPSASTQINTTRKVHPITYVGLVIFLIGSIVNVSSTFTDPGLTALGAVIMIIGAIMMLIGYSLKKSAS